MQIEVLLPSRYLLSFPLTLDEVCRKDPSPRLRGQGGRIGPNDRREVHMDCHSGPPEGLAVEAAAWTFVAAHRPHAHKASSASCRSPYHTPTLDSDLPGASCAPAVPLLPFSVGLRASSGARAYVFRFHVFLVWKVRWSASIIGKMSGKLGKTCMYLCSFISFHSEKAPLIPKAAMPTAAAS